SRRSSAEARSRAILPRICWNDSMPSAAPVTRSSGTDSAWTTAEREVAESRLGSKRGAVEAQELDRMAGTAIDRQIREDLSENRRELETVAREPSCEDDVRMRRVAVDDEVSIGGDRVEAHGMARDVEVHSRQMHAKKALESFAVR